MKAKYRFKKLGFNLIDIGFHNIIHYEKILDKEKDWRLIVKFVLNSYYVSLASKFGKFNYGAFNFLDKKLIKAIEKQLKEITNENK